MAQKKIIAVTGATGAQGGGLVRAILDDPNGGFSARALTRDVDSAKARELADRGAEVLAADVNDPESLRKAFEGAHGAFCVTFFWAHFSVEKEQSEVRNLVSACKAANIRHAIWSTLEDTRRWVPLSDDRMPTLNGLYKVPHFDGKGSADHFFSDAGVPTTYLLTSFYWDNLIHFGMGPKRGPDGKLVLTLPMGDKKLPAIAAEDIGRCAYGIFKRGAEFIGERVGIAGEHLAGAQMADELGQALHEPVSYNAISPATYRGFGFPGAEDLGNMFQFKRDFEADFTKARDIGFSRTLNPKLQTFAAWLKQNVSRIPLS